MTQTKKRDRDAKCVRENGSSIVRHVSNSYDLYIRVHTITLYTCVISITVVFDRLNGEIGKLQKRENNIKKKSEY